MSSEEDDYMSNDFLAKVDDVKPGVSANREAQRLQRISARNEAARERQRQEKPATRIEQERDRREEGIGKPIESENRGFKLLSMMGYKPGMSLGKAREGGHEGIKEPIPIQMKADRTGVGHEEEQKEKQKERCEAHMEVMRKRARMEEVLADDFRSRKRFVTLQKQLISDINRTRRACQEMDIRQGREEPEQFWFWPIYSSKNAEEREAEEEEEGPRSSLDKRRRLQLLVQQQQQRVQLAEQEEGEPRFSYSSGRTAPTEVNFWEMEKQQLLGRLNQLVGYMRSTHFYCTWCGCSFESAEDLSTNCPGTTRSDHEE